MSRDSRGTWLKAKSAGRSQLLLHVYLDPLWSLTSRPTGDPTLGPVQTMFQEQNKM